MATAEKCESLRQVEKLHAEIKRWWVDAAKLEQQGKVLPAGAMRRRMQAIGWHLNRIERTMARTEKPNRGEG